MTVQFSRQAIASLRASLPTSKSGLVHRLVRARNDPGKERIRTCLLNLTDAQLRLGLGLALEDIAVLRAGTPRNPPIWENKDHPRGDDASLEMMRLAMLDLNSNIQGSENADPTRNLTA